MILSPITNQPVLMFVDDLRVTWTGGISGRRPRMPLAPPKRQIRRPGRPGMRQSTERFIPPLALTTVALFDQHPPMNALPQAGLRGKCPNRPKSDFLSEGEGNGVGGADGITICLAALASTTVSAVMLTMRRTVADGVRMCTGAAQPSRIGPTVTFCRPRS